jgi:hypothetical protein
MLPPEPFRAPFRRPACPAIAAVTRSRLIPVAAILSAAIACCAAPAFADDDLDFATAPPESWTRHDPRAAAGLTPTAIFDFAAGQCRIACPPPATMAEYLAAGFARAGLFAPSVYGDAVASVDITAWNPTTNRQADGTFIGVFTRVQEPLVPGALTGYSASIIDLGPDSGPGGVGRNARLQIMLVWQETNFVPLGGYVDFLIDPTRSYRLLLASRGATHTARVFDLAAPAAPAAQLAASDATLATGRTGIMVLTDRAAPVDATFDNFLAWDGSPPPLAIRPGPTPAAITLSSDFPRSLASDLETSTDPANPGQPWQLLTPASATRANGLWTATLPVDTTRRFFRRKTL